MEAKKMSLASIQGKLSRAEMKSIMAGSGSDCKKNTTACTTDAECCSNSCYKTCDGGR
jgi:hypothetical protein